MSDLAERVLAIEARCAADYGQGPICSRPATHALATGRECACKGDNPQLYGMCEEHCGLTFQAMANLPPGAVKCQACGRKATIYEPVRIPGRQEFIDRVYGDGLHSPA